MGQCRWPDRQGAESQTAGPARGRCGKYCLLSRQFKFDDLRLLAEYVHAAKFISVPKAKELVSTIAEFCSTYQVKELQREVFLCDRVKTTIGKIQQDMPAREKGKPKSPQKTSFKYLKYTIQDKIPKWNAAKEPPT